MHDGSYHTAIGEPHKHREGEKFPYASLLSTAASFHLPYTRGKVYIFLTFTNEMHVTNRIKGDQTTLHMI